MVVVGLVGRPTESDSDLGISCNILIPGITAVGLYHYQAAYKDGITINKGDNIVNIERISQARWKGTTPNGKRGLFPSNYVKLHGNLKVCK